ncbi:MAG: hypothetical protein VX278_17215 [Myxococcota bacterium]|nr:hypothetical protein [Myxococcota bacterium]
MPDDNRIPPTEMSKPLSGTSLASKILDVFVMSHVITATSFAGLMLTYPDFFSYFVLQPDDFTALTSDSIRWACPFVFGFAGLAGLSLYMPPMIRRQLAILFMGAFTLAVIVGFSVQTTGRWNEYHPLNIALFASLAIAYGFFAFFYKQAFIRA